MKSPHTFRTRDNAPTSVDFCIDLVLLAHSHLRTRLSKFRPARFRRTFIAESLSWGEPTAAEKTPYTASGSSVHALPVGHREPTTKQGPTSRGRSIDPSASVARWQCRWRRSRRHLMSSTTVRKTSPVPSTTSRILRAPAVAPNPMQ